MGFLEIRRDKVHHYCSLPLTSYGEGTLWQCDDCGTVYKLIEFCERNEYVKSWRREQ